MAGAFRTTPTHALEIDMAVPPIELTMEMTAEGYANRLHRLRHTNPVIDRLPDEWRHSSQTGNPPPLPPRTKAQVKKGTKLTQLERTARLMYQPEMGEKIDPFFMLPWQRTAKDRPQRLSISGVPKGCKKAEEAKKHNEKVEKLVRDNAHLLVYSDGSMREEGDGTRRSTGWGIVRYHLGTEVFVDKGRLGHNAKVYDAELTGIARAVEAAKEYAD
ncbi:hypothetical protein C0989_009056 [Termitomyces sp. Mn162]|nr:hypothetical protein C0989_009056 [Termitomyces sp. Mn162]